MDHNDPRWSWFQGAALALFAAVAGVLGHVMRKMDAGEPVTFWPTFIQGVSAGFVGLLVMWICQGAGLSQQWTAVTVGVSGWLGASATIQVIQRIAWGKLGLNRRPDDGNPQ